MKRALLLAFFLLIASPAAFVAAGLKVDSQKEEIVITESTLYGDPQAAEGLLLKMASIDDSQPEVHLIWDTLYGMGSGKAQSSFTFSSRNERENWASPPEDRISMGSISGWGMAGTVGSGSLFQPENYPMSEVVRAVMERTEAGERRTETVRLADYYEYYPLDFRVSSAIHNVYYDDDTYSRFFDARYSETTGDSQGYVADYLSIPVSDGELWEVILEKDEAGEVIDVDCTWLRGLSIKNVQTFGEEGVYHAYSLTLSVEPDYLEENPRAGGWKDKRVVSPGEHYGIYYYPYTEAPVGYRYLAGFTIDPTQARKVCDLEPEIRLEDMALNEANDRLYLVTREDESIFLRMYEVGETEIFLRQELLVYSGGEERDGEGDFTECRLSVREEGVLMTWSDGTFAFVVCEDEELKLWYPKQEPGVEPGCFRNTNLWDFDGERLALASFVGNQRDGIVNLAVYTENGLAWYGLCEHGGDMYKVIRGVEWV